MAILKHYDHGDLVITILGNQPVNFFEVEYSDEQETQLNYGRGYDVIGYSKGKIDYKTRLVLGMDELVAIQNAAPNGDVKKIKPFTMICTYANDDNQIVNDIITLFFKGAGRKSASGDMNLSWELPIQCLGIQYNVTL